MFVKLFNKLTSICETILAVVPCKASSQVVRGSTSQQHTIARHAWADTQGKGRNSSLFAMRITLLQLVPYYYSNTCAPAMQPNILNFVIFCQYLQNEVNRPPGLVSFLSSICMQREMSVRQTDRSLHGGSL